MAQQQRTNHLPKGAGKYAKDWRKLLAEAKEQGWSWEWRKSSHIHLRRGDQIIGVSLGSGDWRARKNVRARMKRADKERNQ